MWRNNEELFVLAEIYVWEIACIEPYSLESIDSPAEIYVTAERYDHEAQAISTELYGNFTTDSQCGKPCDEDGGFAHGIGDDLGPGDQLGRS